MTRNIPAENFKKIDVFYMEIFLKFRGNVSTYYSLLELDFQLVQLDLLLCTLHFVRFFGDQTLRVHPLLMKHHRHEFHSDDLYSPELI